MRFLCICWFSGGHVLVKCVKGTSQDDKEILLQMDYITDIVISNKTVTGTPYISPDSRNLVIVDEHTGQIKVFTVKENGKKLHFILATVYPQQQHLEWSYSMANTTASHVIMQVFTVKRNSKKLHFVLVKY